MLYCINCGDPISPNEMVCDKCGYRFQIVKGNPNTVYMYTGGVTNVPPVNQGRPAGAPQGQPQGQPQMRPQSAQGQPQGQPQRVQGNPQMQGQRPPQGAPQMQGRPQGPNPQMQGRPVPHQMQGQGIPQGGRLQPSGRPPQAGMYGRPMGARPVPPQGKPKKKKKNGWMIAVAIIMAIVIFAGAVFAALGVIGVGALIAFSGQDDDIEVVVADDAYTGGNSTYTPSVDVVNSTTTTTEDSVTYDNGGILDSTENIALLSTATRDPFVKLKGDGTDTVTVMVYMNGSNLESDDGCATADLKEMLNATLSDNVNVVIQTGGTKKWKTDAISSKHSQRFIIKDGKLVLVDDTLDQLDITKEDTLLDFINYCKYNYPADRNMLIFWDHGSGAVYGFGYDEHATDYYAALTLDEIRSAVDKSGLKFEMIGFDACLMGSLEVACALSDYSDYLVASEDFESGAGWEYQNWLTLLGYNSSTPMKDVGKVIIDDFIKESRSYYGSDGILALIDLRYARLMYSSWTTFAYANESDLLNQNYNMEMQRSDRADGRYFDNDEPKGWQEFFGVSSNDGVLQEYSYAVDILALANTLDTQEAAALKSSLGYAIVYSSATNGDVNMTGLSVTLPYDDDDFYDELYGVFSNSGFDSTYLSFLKKFVTASGGGTTYDWGSSTWDGWNDTSTSNWDDYDWSSYDWSNYTQDDYGFDSYDYSDEWYEPECWQDYMNSDSWGSNDEFYYDEYYYYDYYDDSYDDPYSEGASSWYDYLYQDW